MELSNFYSPQQNYSQSQNQKIFQVKGWLKQKHKQSVIGNLNLGSNSSKYYGQFFLSGKLFVAFQKVPNIRSFQIHHHYFFNQITDVIDNYKAKENHFLVVLSNKNYHYKCDDLQQKQQWVMAFLTMKNLPKQQNNLSYDFKDYYAQIKAEIEICSWGEIKQEFDFGSFVYEKNLITLFQNNNLGVLQTRVLISKCSLEKQQSRGRNSLISNLIQVSNHVEQKTQKKNVYAVLVSRFPINETFQKQDDDTFMLKQQDLPQNVEFFVIYFFQFDNFFDKSKAFDFIILNKEINKEQQNIDKQLLIEYQDHTFNMQFEYFWEFLAWNNAVNKIKDFQKQVEEKQILDLKYNFAKIVQRKFQSNTPKIDEILNNIIHQMKNDKKDLDQRFELALKEWNHFQNSLQSLKNISQKYKIHSGTQFLNNVQKVLIQLWRQNYHNLTAQKCLSFAKFSYQINKSFFEWNYIVNPTMNFEVFTFKVFLNKLFYNSSKIITQIISNFQENIYYENHKILTKCGNQIENLIFFIINHFDYIPTLQSALYLIDLSGIILFNFFINIRIIVGKHQLCREVFMSLLNNKFQTSLGKIYKHLYQKLKKSLQLSQIKALFNNSYFVELIKQIEMKSLDQTCKEFRVMFRLHFVKFQNFMNSNQIKNFRQIYDIMKTILVQIDKKYYIESINYELIQEMFVIYLKQLISNNDQINRQNYKEVIEKIKNDQSEFEKYIEEEFGFDPAIYTYQFQKLLNFLEIEDVDHLVVCILNIYSFYENIAYETNLKQFLKLKIFQPKESIDYIFQYVNDIILQKLRYTLQFQQDSAHTIHNPFVYYLFFRYSKLKRVEKKLSQKQNRNDKKF